MKNKVKHRHERTSWLLSGGYIEWCYVCGAFRHMLKEGDTIYPEKKRGWRKPSGNPDINPGTVLNKDSKR